MTSIKTQEVSQYKVYSRLKIGLTVMSTNSASKKQIRVCYIDKTFWNQYLFLFAFSFSVNSMAMYTMLNVLKILCSHNRNVQL